MNLFACVNEMDSELSVLIGTIKHNSITGIIFDSPGRVILPKNGGRNGIPSPLSLLH